eukprot:jgi/Chlat1/8589/Chrsp86S09232
MMNYMLGRPGPSGFGSASTAEQVASQSLSSDPSLPDHVAIVTGSNSGIGLETARALASCGMTVVMACRDPQRSAAAADIVRNSAKDEAKVIEMALDLASMASVKAFVDTFKATGMPLHILINNAAVMACPRGETADGFEMQFGTNHLGHFLLTSLLLPTLESTAASSSIETRVVNVSSEGHRFTYREGIRFDDLKGEKYYHRWYAYGQAKLANILFTRELARRLKAEGVNVTANSLHPGGIRTELGRHNPLVNTVLTTLYPLFKTIPQGAATSVYCAVSPNMRGVSGAYLYDCNVARESDHAKDDAMAAKLWEVSEELTLGWVKAVQ